MNPTSVLRGAKSGWLVPAGLLALSIFPVAAGTLRMIQLGAGAAITADTARFFAAPLPVVLDILGSVIYCVPGAFQFPRSFVTTDPSGTVQRGGR